MQEEFALKLMELAGCPSLGASNMCVCIYIYMYLSLSLSLSSYTHIYTELYVDR